MNCVEYERLLARRMGGAEASGPGEPDLARLREHAASCDACRGSVDLLDLLALPPAERDRVDEPGEAYWSSFETRLRPRLEAVPERSRGPWWAAAAAVLLLGLLAGWVLQGPRETESPPVVADADTGPTGEKAARAELPPSLLRSLGQASAEEVDSQLAALEAIGSGWDSFEDGGGEAHELFLDGGLLPEVDHLDVETRERLLDWLRDQNRALEGVQG